MKQTAVEWFAKQVLNARQLGFITNEKYNELLEQAKEMEKEQKIEFAFDFYYEYSNKIGVPFNLISENRTNAEAYYNETFKSE